MMTYYTFQVEIDRVNIQTSTNEVKDSGLRQKSSHILAVRSTMLCKRCYEDEIFLSRRTRFP